MSPPVLVASDLDGTLVRTDGSVSDRTRAALRRVEEAGATVVFVTGRPPRWMAQVAGETGASGLAICANGALVYDLGEGRVIRERSLLPEAAAALTAALRAELPEARFAIERGDGFGREPDYTTQWPAPGAQIAELEVLLADPIAKLLVRVPDRRPETYYDRVVELAGDAAVVTYSGPGVLEISGADVSKATTLAALCAERDVRAEQVIAFGDMPNDVRMLTWAGRGIAVANAHPDVLAVADEVTASNDDDGVARVLERLFPVDSRQPGETAARSAGRSS